MTQFYITLGSVPHRDRLVVDIFFKNKLFAEISNDHNEILIEFYSNLDEGYWEFSLDETLQALEMGKKKLLGKTTSD